MASFLPRSIVIVIYCLCFCCFGGVNIRTNGVPWMCNINAENNQIISSLSSSDVKLINKLEQVHAIHRHGARVGSYPISTFLPNAGLKYDCNITSVVTRQYLDNSYYENTSVGFFNLRKSYVKDEQVVEGNCHFRQALDDLIPQHQANAHHIIDAYVGNKKYNLFNQSVLDDIAENLIMYSEDDRIRLATTDYERTIASLTVIASELFVNAFNNIMDDDNMTYDINMNVDVHDAESDPYHPDDNEVCIGNDEFDEWNTMFEGDELMDSGADDIINTAFGNQTITQFEKEGGIWWKNKVGTYLLYPYCAGMTLPLTNETFWNAVKLSYLWGTANQNSSYFTKQTECYNQFFNIPLFYNILRDINRMKKHSYPKLVIHSTHDSTLIRLLKGLGMFDYNLIIFGELITFEIYSAAHDTGLYYFRFTRKGQFIPYPYCDYKNDSTELCDLDVLLTNSFYNVVSQKEWETNLCSNLTTRCKCGYCKNDLTTTSSTKTTNGCPGSNTSSSDTLDTMSITFWVGIGIGVAVGVLIALFIAMITKKFCHRERKDTHAQYFLTDDNVM